MKFIILLAILVVSASCAYPPNRQQCFNGQVQIRNSNSYWECLNSQWTIVTCPSGSRLDQNILKCVPIYAPPPPPQYICIAGTTRADIFDNRKFQRCDNGVKWVEMECPVNAVYDSNSITNCKWLITTTKTSTTTTTTTASPTNGFCSAGLYKPNMNDCRTYYQCDNSHWRLRPCGGGTGWDQINLTCNHIELVCTNDFKPNYNVQSTATTQTTNNGNGF
ncbi:unnamed protein product [Caenorhabditis angaria]|uniref:Chitin-binding type-2 domain-containing protein n=1 Tax=Caenorhabditis angaria TaxID=860376 RepID=A0A9P1I2V8_9PELO|nr:unnamed protein product [Caenorhabditis angaria]